MFDLRLILDRDVSFWEFIPFLEESFNKGLHFLFRYDKILPTVTLEQASVTQGEFETFLTEEGIPL